MVKVLIYIYITYVIGQELELNMNSNVIENDKVYGSVVGPLYLIDSKNFRE